MQNNLKLFMSMIIISTVYVEEDTLTDVGEIAINLDNYSKPQLWWMYFFDTKTYDEVVEAQSSAL